MWIKYKPRASHIKLGEEVPNTIKAMYTTECLKSEEKKRIETNFCLNLNLSMNETNR